jgi:hypothetical protein
MIPHQWYVVTGSDQIKDKPVGVTRAPKPSGLRIGEQLIQGDCPILAYRRRRQELMGAAREA